MKKPSVITLPKIGDERGNLSFFENKIIFHLKLEELI